MALSGRPSTDDKLRAGRPDGRAYIYCKFLGDCPSGCKIVERKGPPLCKWDGVSYGQTCTMQTMEPPAKFTVEPLRLSRKLGRKKQKTGRYGNDRL